MRKSFSINLHVSYNLNIYFAELTWTRFWFLFFDGIFKESISFKRDGVVSHILGTRILDFQSHGLKFSHLE